MTASVSQTSETHAGQLGPKNRVVLPRAVREALGIQEGDTILYVVAGQQVQLTTRRQLAAELCGSLAEPGGRDFTHELLAERRAEAAREKPTRAQR